MGYVSLARDLTKLLEGYEDNPLISENQRAIWNSEGRRKAITHAMLGKDHPNALRLLEEDGYDGRPVGSLSQRSAESFWSYTENHVFPPEDDLIRLGIFMHLDLYRLVALVLKGQWERFFAREICGWRANVGKDLADILRKEDEMLTALGRFNPDTNELFSLLLKHGNIDPRAVGSGLKFEDAHIYETLDDLVERLTEQALRSGVRWLVEAGYTPETFDTLVQRMLLNPRNSDQLGYPVFWASTESPELTHFRKTAIEEIAICSVGTQEEREEYWMLLQARNQLLMDLDELYVQIESARLRNAQVHYEYLRIFGKYEEQLAQERLRYYKLEQKVLLKRANPDLSSEELDKLIEEKIAEERKKIEELIAQIQDAAAIAVQKDLLESIGSGQPLSEEDKAAYLAEAKKILRQIWLLIHPDCLKNNPVYQKLTPNQKEHLDRLFKQALRIRREELGYPSQFFESKYRTIGTLRRILDEIQTILKNAGIEIDLRIEIQGRTLKERLVWLREEIERLEEEMRSARAELYALLNDEEIQQKAAILGNEARHEEIKREMERQAQEYRKKADELEAELKKLMGGEVK